MDGLLLKAIRPRFIWQKVVSVGVKRSGGSEMVGDSKRTKDWSQDYQRLSMQLKYFIGFQGSRRSNSLSGHHGLPIQYPPIYRPGLNLKNKLKGFIDQLIADTSTQCDANNEGAVWSEDRMMIQLNSDVSYLTSIDIYESLNVRTTTLSPIEHLNLIKILLTYDPKDELYQAIVGATIERLNQVFKDDVDSIKTWLNLFHEVLPVIQQSMTNNRLRTVLNQLPFDEIDVYLLEYMGPILLTLSLIHI